MLTKRYLLITCLLVLTGCRSATHEAPTAPKPPMAMIELSPEHKQVVYAIMMAIDPNVFAYREPTLDERFGLK